MRNEGGAFCPGRRGVTAAVTATDKLIGICFCAPAGTERCAGEGELVFELTKHGATSPEGGPACQRTLPAQEAAQGEPGEDGHSHGQADDPDAPAQRGLERAGAD